MIIKIALVVSLCSGVSMQTVQRRIAEIQKQLPNAKITVRIDQKCSKEHVRDGYFPEGASER